MICPTSLPILSALVERRRPPECPTPPASAVCAPIALGRRSRSSSVKSRALAPGVAEDMLDLPRAQRLVDRNDDGSAGEDAEERGGRVGAPAQQDRHAIARADAGVRQRLGERERTRGEPTVIDAQSPLLPRPTRSPCDSAVASSMCAAFPTAESRARPFNTVPLPPSSFSPYACAHPALSPL